MYPLRHIRSPSALKRCAKDVERLVAEYFHRSEPAIKSLDVLRRASAADIATEIQQTLKPFSLRAFHNDALSSIRWGVPERRRHRRGWIAPPMQKFTDLMEQMERDVMDTFGGFEGLERSDLENRLSMDVREEKDSYVVSADVPGMTKEEISLAVSPDGVLTVAGERKGEKRTEGDGVLRVERRFGKFSRSLKLPADADEDSIKAKADNGVLTVTIKKKPDVEVGKKTITIE